MENTSGQGPRAVVPPEAAGWSWGAFLLNWIWGLFNQVYIALLMFIPLVNIVMVFVLGAKGSAWAWQNKRWDSVEQFRRAQRGWAIAGAVVWTVLIAFAAAMFLVVSAIIKDSDAYKLGVEKLQANPQAMAALGPPLKFGFPSGSVQTSGPSGEAELAIPVEGRNASGVLYLEATKKMGSWTANRLELQVEGRAERIDLIRDATPI
jgi:hypothetical protein